MLKQELQARGVPMPQAQTVQEWEAMRPSVRDMLLNEEFGVFFPKPDKVEYRDITVWGDEEVFMGGNHDKFQISVEIEYEGRRGSFPFNLAIPHAGRPCPAFVSINFEPGTPYRYMPTEEILDNGFAIASFCYKDVTNDDGDFSDKIAGVLYGGREREANQAGKISIWSWAASLVMDYLQTLDTIDQKNIAVIGHSRLGKTALLTGAFDERFAFTISNDSGCSGAAVSRGKKGERIEAILTRFPFWFCKNYQKYAGHEELLPFDQNWLLSLIAPRKLMVASASGDAWADPNSEYLGAYAAGEIFKLYGRGFAGPNRFPEPGDQFYFGDVTYHQRPGLHFLSRYDWNLYMHYIKANLNR
jgi:hypothetical protein